MRIKIWEKWYWGIVIGFLSFPLLFVAMAGEKGIRVVSTINNQTTITYVSRPKFFGYGVVLPFAIAFVIWWVIRLITSQD